MQKGLRLFIQSALFADDNAWLYMPFSLSIKDNERRKKTFPEACYTGTTSKLLVWIIMDLQAEDPRSTVLISGVEDNGVPWCIHHQGYVTHRIVSN